MKAKIHAIAVIAAATMILTGCATHQQRAASEQGSTLQNNTSQTQSSTASSGTETTPAGENWSLLDHLPEWAEGTVTPAVTTDPNSGIPFGENPLNDADWTKNLSLDGAPNFNGVTVSVEELKTLPINGYMALNREDEGYSIKGTSEEYDAEEEIDRDIQDYCVTGEEGNYYQIGSYATDGSYAMMLDGDIVFKKLILVQNDYTYRELDYEYGRAIVSDSVGLEEGRTTIGKVQKRKVFYRKNEDGSVTKYTLDTTDITNDIHKWLADRGYSKVG